MDRNVYDALSRLDLLLPLSERQSKLPAALYKVHRLCLETLQQRGEMPDADTLNYLLSNYGVRRGLDTLAEQDLLVMDLAGNPVGVYPMTLEKTPHHLQLPGAQIHAMCAIDALAVAPMFDTEVTITSHCHETGVPIHIVQRGLELVEIKPGNQVWTGIRWQTTSACAAHSLCREMVFLRDADTALSWQRHSSSPVSLLSLRHSVELAAAFFLPLVKDRESDQ